MEGIAIKIYDTRNDHVVLERFTQHGSPVLSWNGSDDNFQTIMSSELNFNMLCENAEDGMYLDLFTGDESRYLVKIERVLNYSDDPNLMSFDLLWQGYLLPDQYSEPYKNVSFFVNFTATDCLGILKDHYFNMLDFDVDETVIRIIAKCLKKTNLYQEIFFSEALKLETVEWDNVSLNSQNFRGDTELGEFLMDLTDYDSCYDVLNKILQALACTLFSYEGKWYIVGWNKKHLVTDSFRVYDFHGNFKRKQSLFKIVRDQLKFDLNPIIYMNSPLKQVDITADLGFAEDVYEKLTEFSQGSIFLEPHDPRDYWSGASFDLNKNSSEGKFILYTSGMVSLREPKGPFCMSYKLKNSALATGNNYITIHQDHLKFISETSVGSGINLEIEIDMFALTEFRNWGNESSRTAFDQGYYNYAFRVDIYVGGVLKASTRRGTSVYSVENAPVLTYEEGSVIDSNPNESSYRILTENKIKAQWRVNLHFFEDEGDVSIRFYDPVFPVYVPPVPSYIVQEKFEEIFIPKLIVKQKQSSKKYSYNGRNINYSKSEKINLPFWESKSDLTYKNFRVFYGPFRMWSLNLPLVREVIVLSNRIETESYITYNLSNTDAEWLKKNYSYAKIEKDGVEYYLKDVFGDFNYLAGYYLITDGLLSKIYFNKNVIQNLFYLWKPFADFVIKTYKGEFSFYYPREFNPPFRPQSMRWKRYGSDSVTGYGVAYARAMLESKAEPYLKVDGTVKKIIGPLDVIRYKWIEDRDFWISNLSLNFSEGKSKVFLCESKFKNIDNDT